MERKLKYVNFNSTFMLVKLKNANHVGLLIVLIARYKRHYSISIFFHPIHIMQCYCESIILNNILFWEIVIVGGKCRQKLRNWRRSSGLKGPPKQLMSTAPHLTPADQYNKHPHNVILTADQQCRQLTILFNTSLN